MAFWRETGLGIMWVGCLPRPGVEVLKSSGNTTEKEERLSNTASAGCFSGVTTTGVCEADNSLRLPLFTAGKLRVSDSGFQL